MNTQRKTTRRTWIFGGLFAVVLLIAAIGSGKPAATTPTATSEPTLTCQGLNESLAVGHQSPATSCEQVGADVRFVQDGKTWLARERGEKIHACLAGYTWSQCEQLARTDQQVATEKSEAEAVLRHRQAEQTANNLESATE